MKKIFFPEFSTFMGMLFFQGLNMKNQENLTAKKKKKTDKSIVQNDSF